MTTSENEENHLSASDERTVASAHESLTTVLRKDSCTPEEISLALEYLSELKSRVMEVGERRPALQSELDRFSEASEASSVQQQRIDQDIIDAKLKVSELLSEKDSIARDLARARRALNEAEEDLETPVSGSTNDHANSATAPQDSRRLGGRDQGANGTISAAAESGGFNDLEDEEDVDALQKILANEMERLRIAQEKLVSVVDDTNSARKKRAELQEKVNAAQEEW